MKLNFKSAGRISPAFLFKQDGLHPAVKIAGFILMAVLIPHLKFSELLSLAFALSLALIHFRVRRFVSTLRRMRWLFLSMLIIYAYTTPGEYLRNWPIDLAPSYEGLREGFYQIARISLVLAGISLLMTTSTRENLMAGIYTIIKPLSLLNVSPERFTARLYLTLQYIDKTKKRNEMQDKISGWQEGFLARLSNTQDPVLAEIVSLDIPSFGLLDGLCVLVFLIAIGLHL